MKNWNLKECNVTDLNKVLEFLNENFSNKDQNFVWEKKILNSKIFENPVADGLLIYGLTDDDKIIGTASLTIKKLYYKNKEIKIGEIGDTFTAQSKSYIDKNGYEKFQSYSDNDLSHIKNHKNLLFIKKSIFGKLVDNLKSKAKKEGINLIYGTANSNSSASYLNRLEFTKENKKQVNEYFLITVKIIIQRFKYLKKLIPLIKIFLKVFHYLYFKFLVNHKNLNIELVASINHKKRDINNFWKNYSFKDNLIVRDYEYIKWRYFNNNNYKIYFLYKKEKLISWIVVREKDSKEFKKITICDFIYKCSKAEFLYFFYEILKKHDYQNCIINLWSNIGSEIFNSAIFYKNKKINLIYYFIDKNLENDFDSIKNFTIGCSDNI